MQSAQETVTMILTVLGTFDVYNVNPLVDKRLFLVAHGVPIVTVYVMMMQTIVFCPYLDQV